MTPAASATTSIIMVRHGQSVANAGGVTADHVTNPLTDFGWEQARKFAQSFSHKPRRFILSPFLRAQQTAEPMLQRFPDVPVEIWPVHEFTYLEPTRHNGTCEAQRTPAVIEFWNRADPAFVDGPDAESFSSFVERARDAARRLAALPPGGSIVIFTHGFWMQAFRLILLFPRATDADLMANFRRFHFANVIRNTETLKFELSGSHFQPIDQEHLNAFTLQGEPSNA
jgi:broad specificity phosphatase PhoE